MKDYNIKLMQALHSIFWYQGLLETIDTEEGCPICKVIYRDEDDTPLSIPVYSETGVISQLIQALREKRNDLKHPTFNISDMEKICEDFKPSHEFNVIWMILVEMFGNCGTSPRTGWIEKCEECADFLDDIINIREYCFKNSM